MRPIERRVRWLPFGIVAITLWPFIIYAPKAVQSTRVHELYHWFQIERWRVAPWYIWYLMLALLVIGKPANYHPLERGAYEAQWAWEREHPTEVGAPLSL